jgi:hypothetical protein
MVGIAKGMLQKAGHRRRALLVAVLLLLATSAAGPLPASAEYPPGYGFQWGPSRPPEQMAEPLNSSLVVSAVKMFVDEDEISERLLGAPGFLVFVSDPTYPNELEHGWKDFAPEKASRILEQEGITDIELTIAPDPSVAETRELAEAIVEEMRENGGVKATVVEGEADFLVTRALGRSAPAAPGAISYEVECTPDTFRPDEWVVVECFSRMTNRGETDLIQSITIDPGSGTTPDYSFLFTERDGERVNLGTQPLGFPATELLAGETVVTRTLVLLKMSEGTYESSLSVKVNDDVVTSAPLRYTASAEAEEPPTDLEVSRELVDKKYEFTYTPVPDPPHDGYATYETRITNSGSSAVSDLEIVARLVGVGALTAEPPPAREDMRRGLFSWDLSSFGKESLAPGESLVLRTTHMPSAEFACETMATAGVVEATVGGEVQRYALPNSWERVGYCLRGGGGRGGGAPTGLAFGGHGPDALGGGVVWPSAALAALGVALISMGLFTARRGAARAGGASSQGNRKKGVAAR